MSKKSKRAALKYKIALLRKAIFNPGDLELRRAALRASGGDHMNLEDWAYHSRTSLPQATWRLHNQSNEIFDDLTYEETSK